MDKMATAPQGLRDEYAAVDATYQQAKAAKIPIGYSGYVIDGDAGRRPARGGKAGITEEPQGMD